MSAQPQLGRFCRWCGEPAVDEVEIEPTQYGTTKGRKIVARQAIRADVCAAHAEVRDREGGAPPSDPRRRKSMDAVQLDIFGEIVRKR